MAVSEYGDRGTIVAGTGSNDTAHTVHLTERATALGCDAMLCVTPYYNKPNFRGLVAHYEAIAAVTDRPIVLYNIPSRCVVDISNDELRRSSRRSRTSARSSRRATRTSSRSTGSTCSPATTTRSPRCSTRAATGGITVASHLVGPEMRRMFDEPDSRADIHAGLAPVFKAMAVTTNPMPVKTAMGMLGHGVGGFRLPMVEASDDEKAVIRGALEQHGLLSAV